MCWRLGFWLHITEVQMIDHIHEKHRRKAPFHWTVESSLNKKGFLLLSLMHMLSAHQLWSWGTQLLQPISFPLQATKPSSCRTCLHQSVLYSEVHRRGGLRRCHDLLVCHDSENIPKQCGDCFGEWRLSPVWSARCFGCEYHEKTQKAPIVTHML